MLGLSRTQLHINARTPIDVAEEQRFAELIMRRTRGEPIAYLLGQREFWSLNFFVTPDTLIPRPETELLVELLLAKLPAEPASKIADLGTGCGAIALAIASERPHWSIVATDYAEAALAVAQRNAEHLQLKNVAFRQGHWCAALAQERFAAIVSNPPYIANDLPEDLRFEPVSALLSPNHGLSDLAQIIDAAPAHLVPGGWLLLEHGYDQAAAVQSMLHARGFDPVEGYADLAGIMRVAIGQLPF